MLYFILVEKSPMLGQAHSVNNLSYNSFYYKYHGANINAGGITRWFLLFNLDGIIAIYII